MNEFCSLPPPTPTQCNEIPICPPNWSEISNICSLSMSVSSCLQGFMYVNPSNASLLPPKSIQNLPLSHSNNSCYEQYYPYTRACCPGYYCPESMYCMMPCALKGSYCPSSNTLTYPQCSLGNKANNNLPNQPLFGKYKYFFGCGGSISNNITCPNGNICVNSKTMQICPKGYFCRDGSVEPTKCTEFMTCPIGTQTPQISILTSILLAMVIVFIVIFKLYEYFKKMILKILNSFLLWKNNESLERYIQRRKPIGSEKNLYSDLLGSSDQIKIDDIDINDHIGSVNNNNNDANPQFFNQLRAKLGSLNNKIMLFNLEDDDINIELDEKKDDNNSNNNSNSKILLHENKEAMNDDMDDNNDNDSNQSIIDQLQAMIHFIDPNGYKKSSLDFMMDIEFKNLTLKLNNAEKSIIVDDISGHLKCGTVTAIMGPSGAGKTSFLYTLCGKAGSYANMEGQILINGENKSLKDFQDIVGFVPQSDAMTAYMTVKEMLTFNAKFRLSKKYSTKYRKCVVRDVMKLLKIYDIRHSLIGDDKKRGISGGQKKRVNIGCELVAQPSILFLDEPTSGLDSTTSNDIMNILKSIANTGTTIISVLHQPRYEIFKKFDNLILLSKGGKLVYFGNTSKVMPYFKNFGFVKNNNVNPADFLLDVISGSVVSNDLKFDYLNLPILWKEKFMNNYPLKENIKLLRYSHLKNNKYYQKRNKISFIEQIYICFIRSLKIGLRQQMTIIIDIIMILFTGFVLGFITDSNISSVPSNILFTIMSSSVVGSIISLRLFGNDRLMYYRFSSVGINRFSYYIGQILAGIPWIMFEPFLFLLFYWPLSLPHGKITTYYYILMIGMFVVQGLSQLVSIIIDSTKSLLVAVVLVMIFNFFDGFQPSLNHLKLSIYGRIATNISYARWQQESLWMKELQSWPEVFELEIDAQKNQFGWLISNEQFNMDIIAMMGIGLIFRFLSFMALIFYNRNKQR